MVCCNRHPPSPPKMTKTIRMSGPRRELNCHDEEQDRLPRKLLTPRSIRAGECGDPESSSEARALRQLFKETGGLISWEKGAQDWAQEVCFDLPGVPRCVSIPAGLQRGDPCSWFGITCNADNRVTAIRLPHNGLSGPISERGRVASALLPPFFERTRMVLSLSRPRSCAFAFGADASGGP